MSEFLILMDRWPTENAAMNRRMAVILVIFAMVLGVYVWLFGQAGAPRRAAELPNGETPVAETAPLAAVVKKESEPITPATTLSVEERVLKSAIEELELWQAIRSEADPAKRSELESRSQTIQTERLHLYDFEQE